VVEIWFGSFTVPSGRFQHVHMDLVGPLPLSNGFKYLVTMIDRFSRWPIPLKNIDSVTVANAFIHNWVSRYGVLRTITKDLGRQFESNLFRELFELFGCHRIRTTSYHAQANGMIERFHRHLKASIRARDGSNNWFCHLPWIMLGIRTSGDSWFTILII